MNPWICPKCGRVYNGMVMECKACNKTPIAFPTRPEQPGPVLRALTEAGDITQEQAEQILLFEAWEPELAHTVAMRWAAKAGAARRVWGAQELYLDLRERLPR